MLTAPDIARLLARYLSSADAERRACAVAEDMAAVEFELHEDRSVPPERWRAMGVRPQAEYTLPKTGFDLNGDDPDKSMEGSLLTRGNLLRLEHAVQLGRKWLPGVWPGEFRRKLVGREHLDALNEVYWLKFWNGLQAVQRGPKVNPADPDTDWQLALKFGDTALTINLEVKRRTGNLNAWFKKGLPRISLKSIGHKFEPSDARTLNLAAMTVFKRPDLESMSRVRKVVDESPVLDGVVVWIEDNAGGAPLLRIFKNEKRWAETVVRDPDCEDLMIGAFTSGTLCQPDEVPQFIERMLRATKSGH